MNNSFKMEEGSAKYLAEMIQMYDELLSEAMEGYIRTMQYFKQHAISSLALDLKVVTLTIQLQALKWEISGIAQAAANSLESYIENVVDADDYKF